MKTMVLNKILNYSKVLWGSLLCRLGLHFFYLVKTYVDEGGALRAIDVCTRVNCEHKKENRFLRNPWEDATEEELLANVHIEKWVMHGHGNLSKGELYISPKFSTCDRRKIKVEVYSIVNKALLND